MTDIDKLLERLEEEDEKTYRDILESMEYLDEGLLEDDDGYPQLEASIDYFEKEIPLYASMARYIIQGRIQQEIAAQGWDAVICASPYFRDVGKEFHVEIILPGHGVEVDAATPAEAILEAYLAALEAMG